MCCAMCLLYKKSRNHLKTSYSWLYHTQSRSQHNKLCLVEVEARRTVWSVLFDRKRLCSKEEEDVGESYNWYMITCCPCRQPASSPSGRSRQLELCVQSYEPVWVMKHWTICACCALSFRTKLCADCAVK